LCVLPIETDRLPETHRFVLPIGAQVQQLLERGIAVLECMAFDDGDGQADEASKGGARGVERSLDVARVWSSTLSPTMSRVAVMAF
jgi:hypothetical protein